MKEDNESYLSRQIKRIQELGNNVASLTRELEIARIALREAARAFEDGDMERVKQFLTRHDAYGQALTIYYQERVGTSAA